MALDLPAFYENALTLRRVCAKVAIVGSQTQASIKTYCENIGSVLVYNEDDSRTVTAVDAGIGFALTDLDNDAPPAVLGVLLPVGNAAELVRAIVPAETIYNTGLSGAMTAGVLTLKGQAASGTTGGITTSANISFIVSCTSLDIDEDNATGVNCSFWVDVTYRATQPAY